MHEEMASLKPRALTLPSLGFHSQTEEKSQDNPLLLSRKGSLHFNHRGAMHHHPEHRTPATTHYHCRLPWLGAQSELLFLFFTNTRISSIIFILHYTRAIKVSWQSTSSPTKAIVCHHTLV